MKAVILVGGEGTRLRPLTSNTPKPLLPVVNRPFMDHILYLLRLHGIHDVVLAMAYKSESFEKAYGDGSHLDMHLTYMREEVPMGTGGAIKNVEAALTPGETFVVFNGDILTDLDLTDMLSLHKSNNSICTISLTPVDDPSAYGVVDLDDAGRITRFTEKPKREDATSNWINAGTYILEAAALDRIPQGEHHMVERGLFPNLLAEGQRLYGYKTGAYWMDIGTPTKYLQAHEDLLGGRLKHNLAHPGEELQSGVWAGEGTFIDAGARVSGPVVLGKGCKIRANASLTGPAVLGDNCEVGEAARLERVIAWNGVSFGRGSVASDAIVGNHAAIGEGCHLTEESVIGDNATVGANNRLAGEKLASGGTMPEQPGAAR